MQWGMERCEVRSRGGTALVAGNDAIVHIYRCGLGGCGKKAYKATNVMSVHGKASARVEGTTVSYAEHGGLRCYGSSVAFVRKLLAHHIGSYGLLVDQYAHVTAWNCSFRKVYGGAFATSIQAQNCSLLSGGHVLLDSRSLNQSEWWGPQRPGTLVNISSLDQALEATSTLPALVGGRGGSSASGASSRVQEEAQLPGQPLHGRHQRLER